MMDLALKAPRPIPLLLVLGLALAAYGTLWLRAASDTPAPDSPANPPKPTPGTRVVRHDVAIRPGPQTPTVLTNALNHGGEPVAVACSTCHTTRQPNIARNASADLTEFHQGLAYKHGDQSCLSCHNASNYDTLRKANGTAVPYPAVMELCGQCHGPQYRDYKAGAHGGMNGYWNLSKGPRVRNNCVDCHDPHAPAYPRVKPVFAPIDRGARQQQERAAAHQESSHE